MSKPPCADSKGEVGSKAQNASVDTSSTSVDFPYASGIYGRNETEMSTVKFHSILKKLMDEKKISSRALSKAVSIPHSTLSSYLSGKKASYSAEHIGQLAAYFKVSSDYLLFGKENPLSALNEIPTEGLFEGWLKVKIERAIPSKKSGGNDER